MSIFLNTPDYSLNRDWNRFVDTKWLNRTPTLYYKIETIHRFLCPNLLLPSLTINLFTRFHILTIFTPNQVKHIHQCKSEYVYNS